MSKSLTKIFLFMVFLLGLTVNIFPDDQNRDFIAPHRARVGELLAASASADLNDDGKIDSAVIDSYRSYISIMLGDGFGNLALLNEYQTGLTPQDIKIGKFNNDNFPDLVIANSGENTITILYGNGDGTFSAAVNFNAGGSPTYLVSSDINRDTFPDLIAVNNTVSAHGVAVLLGNDDGSFSLENNIPFGRVPVSATIGDFNGDGDPDLAVVDRDLAGILILHGDGAGNFTFTRNYGVGLSPVAAVSEDFNGDGKPDLAGANFGSGNVSLLKNVAENSLRRKNKDVF